MDAVGAIVRLMLPGRYLYGFQEKTSTHVCVSCKRCRPILRADSIQSSVFCTCCVCLSSLKLKETRKASKTSEALCNLQPNCTHIHRPSKHRQVQHNPNVSTSRQLPDQIQLKHSRNLITVPPPSSHWPVRSNFHWLPPSPINNDFPSNFPNTHKTKQLRPVLPNPMKAFFCLQ
jgi:hypothetical protein